MFLCNGKSGQEGNKVRGGHLTTSVLIEDRGGKR